MSSKKGGLFNSPANNLRKKKLDNYQIQEDLLEKIMEKKRKEERERMNRRVEE